MGKSSAKANEDWMNTKWRPAMGWMYMMVCIFDFIVFPMGFTAVQFWEVEAANDAFRQWNPITMSGAGMFHVAMGAVLGIAAWSRGQEKMAGVSAETPALAPTQQTVTTTYAAHPAVEPVDEYGEVPEPPVRRPPPPKPVF